MELKWSCNNDATDSSFQDSVLVSFDSRHVKDFYQCLMTVCNTFRTPKVFSGNFVFSQIYLECFVFALGLIHTLNGEYDVAFEVNKLLRSS